MFKYWTADIDRQKPPILYLQLRVLTLHVVDVRTGSPRSIGKAFQLRLATPTWRPSFMANQLLNQLDF